MPLALSPSIGITAKKNAPPYRSIVTMTHSRESEQANTDSNIAITVASRRFGVGNIKTHTHHCTLCVCVLKNPKKEKSTPHYSLSLNKAMPFGTFLKVQKRRYFILWFICISEETFSCHRRSARG